jgi:hypothetical protein
MLQAETINSVNEFSIDVATRGPIQPGFEAL